MIYAVAALLAVLVASYWWRERKAKKALREAALTIRALQRTVRAAEEAGAVKPIVITTITRRCDGRCTPIRSLN